MSFEVAYVIAGVVLASYYWPQIAMCWQDDSGLGAYSLSKGVAQLLCRLAMFPFVLMTVPSMTIVALQGMEGALRAFEVGAAVAALRRQGWAWSDIGHRAIRGTSAAKHARTDQGTKEGDSHDALA